MLEQGNRVQKLIIIFMSVFLLSCATAQRGNYCALVSEGDGWIEISKPEGIEQSTTWYSGRFILWYKNSSGHILACEREYRDPVCFTVGTIYIQKNGKWERTDGDELIVCT
jgi:hypothetical protein